MAVIKNLKQLDGIELSCEKDERIIRDNKWIEGINRHDKKAFESIYRCYFPQLYRFALRMINSGNVAEDIIHNVFYHVWQKRTTIKPQGTLKAYLFTAVRNQALKYIRKQNRQKIEKFEINCIGDTSQDNPEKNMELRELNLAYKKTVEKLPERRRNIFLMHRVDKMTYREIAEILEISIKTVETQMSRSLKFLAQNLAHFK